MQAKPSRLSKSHFADTKYEFGLVDDKIVLIDEILADSSRYWKKALTPLALLKGKPRNARQRAFASPAHQRVHKQGAAGID